MFWKHHVTIGKEDFLFRKSHACQSKDHGLGLKVEKIQGPIILKARTKVRNDNSNSTPTFFKLLWKAGTNLLTFMNIVFLETAARNN